MRWGYGLAAREGISNWVILGAGGQSRIGSLGSEPAERAEVRAYGNVAGIAVYTEITGWPVGMNAGSVMLPAFVVAGYLGQEYTCLAHPRSL